jgi:hypothetical protein
MLSIRTVIAQVLATAGSIVAIASAPLVHAAPAGPICTYTGNATTCQTNDNAQITADRPPTNFQQQYPFFGAFPYGPILRHHHD